MLRGAIVFTLFIACSSSAVAQPTSTPVRSGEELFRSGCVTCHGIDGQGGVREQMGFDEPVPNFAECSTASPEPDSDWLAMIHEGGRARAFPRRMPAFQDLLTGDEIGRIVQYLRGFCADRAWPRGDLNLPRALFTEKAFPENESLLTTSIDHGDAAAVSNNFLYEHRIGARSQYEVSVPLDAQKSDGTWAHGLGDITLAFKHVAYHDLDQGGILSGGVEVLLPTGKESLGLGKGVTIFEPFVAYGQMLPADGFLQVHTGFELPTDSAKAHKEAFVRAALGKSFTQGAWGRSWSPMAELLVAHEVADGEPTLWDVVPQMQVSLSRRQHIMLSAGVRVPLNARSERGTQLVTYFLWDWFDGGLFEGWK